MLHWIHAFAVQPPVSIATYGNYFQAWTANWLWPLFKVHVPASRYCLGLPVIDATTYLFFRGLPSQPHSSKTRGDVNICINGLAGVSIDLLTLNVHQWLQLAWGLPSATTEWNMEWPDMFTEPDRGHALTVSETAVIHPGLYLYASFSIH